MSVSITEVHITKIAAAQRQIDAAVRMFFAGEDELAVHTVAAAAYRIVRDLRNKRGRPEIPREADAEGRFFVAKAYAKNEAHILPQALRKAADRDQQIQELAEFLRQEGAKQGRELELDELAISVFGIDERAHWSTLNEAANFLKHADQDNRKSISLSKINNYEELLGDAISSFFSLTKKVTPEMGVFMLYQSAKVFEDVPHLQGSDAKIVGTLHRMEPEMRGRACLKLVSILKRKNLRN